MNRNYFVVIAAIALFCLLLIFVSLWQEIDTPLTKEVTITPNIGPYHSQLVGVGIVEPISENIYIGTPLNRIIRKVFVKVGQKIKKGEALFALEHRDLVANLNLQKTIYEIALAKFQRMKSLPQPEDLQIAQALLDSAKVSLELAKNQYEMVLQLSDQRALSQEERERRLFAYRQAEVKWNQAQFEYEKIKQGSWKPDLEIAHLDMLQAQANVDLVTIEIARTTIRSPIDGTVLQIKIHEGELPSLDIFRVPPMIIGNIDEFYLRVSINQLDIPLFRSAAPAVAYLQGDHRLTFPLEFVRLEPFLVNKQNLTNDINEKVDTRVMQIIYLVKNEGHPLFIGQQMDVFIETEREQNG